jgi:L-2-hydroxyglutarate oxidase LhgO
MSEKLLAEYAVVGGGIIGLTIALEIAKRDPKATIHLYEKETDPGTHASTRNSGVLHAGFYYAPNSLKAKLAVRGHELLKKFCLDYNLPLDQCGKVVVATNADEAKQVLKLQERAVEVGVTTELVDIPELSRIEPQAKSHEVALWSPMTSIGDSFAVLKQLEMLLPKNIEIRRKSEVR